MRIDSQRQNFRSNALATKYIIQFIFFLMKRKYILPDEEKTNHGKPFLILSKLTNIIYFPMIDSNILMN